MFYKISSNIGLRKWKYVDRAVYVKGIDHALPVSKEEFETLLLCDSKHNLENNQFIDSLLKKNYIIPCYEDERISEWSKFKEYDNLYFPKINLMLTGKCNLNCLHCFNAKDNAPLNSELSYDKIIELLDQAKDIGVHAFTITGGEPLFHNRFLDIVKAIYERDMYVFELNTNGFLLNQKVLDEFKKIGCHPLIKISYDGIGFHNWIRQNEKADELTINAIKLCISNGFKVKVQTQVNLKNIDCLLKTSKLLNDLGVYEMRIIRTTEAPRWQENAPGLSLSFEDYYQKMLEFAKEYSKTDSQMIIDIWQYIKLYPKEKTYSLAPIKCNKDEYNFRIPMCKGNRGMIAITSSGEVIPCLQMSGYFMEKGISLANIYTNTLREIITSSKYLELATAPILKMILENKKCPNCKYFKVCAGGCPALGLLYSGSENGYFHEDVTKCYFFKNGWYEKIVQAMNDWKTLNQIDI